MAQSLAKLGLAAIQKQKMLQAGDRVGVAASGGADSVALLLLLVELREKLGILLSVVHFNHKLRGKASDQDEQFVEKLAARLGLPFHVGRLDVAAQARHDKSNLEDAARRARYAYFQRLAEDDRVTRIAVAHTADDQAETVIAHMLRGTGLAGLGGIHPIADHIVRPLLDFRRADLRVYLRSKKQPWREDTSNRDTTRTRARIRKNLIPLLEKQFQPAVVQHLNTLAKLAREDEVFLDLEARAQAGTLGEKTDDGIRIQISGLRLQPRGPCETAPNPSQLGNKYEAMTKRIIRCIVEEVKPGRGQLNAQHVDSILQLAERGENGKLLRIPGGVEIRRDENALQFRAIRATRDHGHSTNANGKSPIEFDYPIDLTAGAALVQVPELGCVFRFTLVDWPAKRGETSDTGLVLDRDTLSFPLVLRNWRPGDTLRPLGHRSAHKLKRLLNKKRIGRWQRDGWPVLTSGGVLVWARGFSVAAESAANERTRAGIVIAEEKVS